MSENQPIPEFTNLYNKNNNIKKKVIHIIRHHNAVAQKLFLNGPILIWTNVIEYVWINKKFNQVEFIIIILLKYITCKNPFLRKGFNNLNITSFF